MPLVADVTEVIVVELFGRLCRACLFRGGIASIAEYGEEAGMTGALLESMVRYAGVQWARAMRYLVEFALVGVPAHDCFEQGLKESSVANRLILRAGRQRIGDVRE